jgi:membrane protein
MASRDKKPRNTWRDLRAFLTQDIWQVGEPGEKNRSGFFVKNTRVAILLTRGITEESLLLRASALSFATILFIVPFMVFMFALIQTFDLGDVIYLKLSKQINTRLEAVVQMLPFDSREQKQPEEAAVPDAAAAGNAGDAATTTPAEPPVPEVARFDVFGVPNVDLAEEPAAKALEELDPLEQTSPPVFEKLPEDQRRKAFWNALIAFFLPHFEYSSDEGKEYLDPIQMLVEIAEDGTTSLGSLGITGLLWVLITVFGFMRNVEWSLNQIWGVKKSRSILRTFTDYVVITLLLPFVAAVVLAITAGLATLDTTDSFRLTLRGGQFVLIVLTFTLLYKMVPNTKVQTRYALLGGLVAGAAWMLMSWGYVTFQVGLARNVFFFSTFALFPLFLFWVYTSWVILLYGALLSFAYQNEKTFAMEQFVDTASHAYKEAVAVRAAVDMTRRFRKGQQALTVAEMAEQWNIPTRLLNDLMDQLTEAGLVSMCASDPVRYQPGRAPETTHINDIIRVVREAGVDCSQLRREKLYRPLYKGLEEGDNHYLDMTIAAMAEQLDRKEEREAPTKPEGKMISYPGGAS